MFDLAHEFAQADAIVIAAPMWGVQFFRLCCAHI